MPSEAAQFLRALLDRVSNVSVSAVLEEMPEEMRATFQNLPAKSEKPAEKFFLSYKDVLAPLHHSWYEELLPYVAEELRPVMQRALEEKEESALRAFLLTYLVKAWPGKEIPDRKEVTGTPFSFLLNCDEDEIIRLQDLIVVYDIVDEVRQIVEKKKLQQVFQRLTPLQQQYLRSLLHRPARARAFNLGIVGLLRQDPQRGADTLHRRGIDRFSCALKDEVKPFLWYFFHRIEKRQALELQTAMESTASTNERAQAKKHLAEAYQFLQSRSRSGGTEQ